MGFIILTELASILTICGEIHESIMLYLIVCLCVFFLILMSYMYGVVCSNCETHTREKKFSQT